MMIEVPKMITIGLREDEKLRDVIKIKLIGFVCV